MTQDERRLYLIRELMKEDAQYRNMQIPPDKQEQKKLLRSLFNVRMPIPIKDEFLAVQDEYLQTATAEKGITDITELTTIQKDIYIWKGDITTLRCDAIVNAANSALLGCFCPCHYCIDNAIHTYAGIQLRAACAKLMKEQGHKEETGTAKITSAYNLPCRYVIHTVGPIISNDVTQKSENQLASCYRSCLELAEQNNIKSIAFCCISTGEFHFPNDRAAEIAVNTVTDYKQQTGSRIEVIFNVFKQIDYEIYRNLLG